MAELLTEIGELFGKYRNERGDLEFFQKKLRKSDGHLVTDYNQFLSYHSRNVGAPDPEKNKFLNSVLNTNFDGDPSRRFYGWQVKVLDRLQNSNNDIYVVAPPGGGKTTPLMAHYMVDIFMDGKNGRMPSLEPEKILDNSASQDIIQKWINIFHSLLSGRNIHGQPTPRCLFITPIRVLSFEQAEGFQDYFLDLLLFLKSLFLKLTKRNDQEAFSAYMTRLKQSQNHIDKIIGSVFDSLGEEYFKRIQQDPKPFGNWAKQFTEKMICVKTGGGSGNYNDNPNNALVIIATYGSAKSFISNISNKVKFIVFDEAHLYMPSEHGGERSQENEVRAAADAYTIIDGMSKQKGAQIAFLSGTIHPISAENFCSLLNKYYGRNLAVVSTEKGDTEAGNKTDLHVIPDDAIRSEKEQVNRIVKWVQNNEKGNAIILFSKRKINALVDAAVQRLSQKDIRADFNTPTSDRYRKEKIDRYRRALAYSNPDLKGKDLQDEIDKFIKREFPTTQSEEIEKIKNKPGAMMIQNSKLRTAVGCGIGFIYRQDEVELNDPVGSGLDDKQSISEDDKIIVAKLFSEGKINVLIATDSIGIGVNVNIKNMYLPSCMKFEKNKNNDGKMQLSNKRNLSQLINRTGRGKTPVSGIYTPNEFVPYLQNIVTSGAANYNIVPAITIRPTDNLKEVLLNLMDAVSNSAAVNKSKDYYDIGKKLARFVSSFPVKASHTATKAVRFITLDLIKRKYENRRRITQESAAKFADTNNEFQKLQNEFNNILRPELARREQELSDALRDLNAVQRDPNSSPADLSSALVDYIYFQNEYDQFKFDLMHMMTDRYLKIKNELKNNLAYNSITRHGTTEIDAILNIIKSFNKDNDILKIDSTNELNKIIMERISNLNKEIQNISSLLNNPNISPTDIQKLTTEINQIKSDISTLTRKIKR